QRIFRARIVAGEDDDVAELAGGLAHQWALGAVAVAAGAEEGDDAAGFEGTRGGDGVAEGVVRVGVIDDDVEGLASVDALEAAGDAGAGGACLDDDFGWKLVRHRGAAGTEDVEDVEAAGERRKNFELRFVEGDFEAHAVA